MHSLCRREFKGLPEGIEAEHGDFHVPITSFDGQEKVAIGIGDGGHFLQLPWVAVTVAPGMGWLPLRT